jgi:hypothetical protein
MVAHWAILTVVVWAGWTVERTDDQWAGHWVVLWVAVSVSKKAALSVGSSAVSTVAHWAILTVVVSAAGTVETTDDPWAESSVEP